MKYTSHVNAIVVLCGLLFSSPSFAEEGSSGATDNPTAQEAAVTIKPLTADEKSILFGTSTDVLDKPDCTGNKRASIDCKDKWHYVTSNEPHHHIFRSVIEDIGGGYVGVGADQGLTFVAWAKSDIAWLIDYDIFVVRVNLIRRALILEAESREDYVALWNVKNQKKTEEIIQKAYADHDDLKSILRAFKRYRKKVHKADTRHLKRSTKYRQNHWLHDAKTYNHIRAMYKADRIRVMPGDLLKKDSLAGINEASRKLNVPIRIVYFSNAEEFWNYPDSFRDSFSNLKMDDQSVILRTRASFRRNKETGDETPYGYRKSRWRFIMQGGPQFQEFLADKKIKRVQHILRKEKCHIRQVCHIGLSDIQTSKLTEKDIKAGKKRLVRPK